MFIYSIALQNTIPPLPNIDISPIKYYKDNEAMACSDVPYSNAFAKFCTSDNNFSAVIKENVTCKTNNESVLKKERKTNNDSAH